MREIYGLKAVYRASTFKQLTSPAMWAKALAKLPHSHVLQSWLWGEFKSRWGWSALPLVVTIAENSWEPLAAALVLKRKIPFTPFSILYVPKGPILDYNDRPLRQQVLALLEKLSRKERAIFIKVDPEVVWSWGVEQERVSPLGKGFVAELEARGWQFSPEQIQFRNTVELDLTESEEALLAGMKPKTRYNIRLAERKGIRVREGTVADLPVMAAMYAETAARDQFTIRPTDYYLDIWKDFCTAGIGQLLLAEYEEEPVAALLLVKYGARAIYMYGASTDKERNRMPNYLLQWEAIGRAKAAGCTVYDFWGAPNEFVETDKLWGVWRFKDGFQGEVVRHIGAWDYPVRPWLYWAYSQAIPKYLKLLRGRRA
jgi:lipid II:glycine glycyltransferase (peptidoglycan interpeptide bridge formation enzyme)